MLSRILSPEVTIDQGRIALGGVVILFTLVIMLFSEVLNKGTRGTYEEKFGFGSWKNVPFYSALAGLLSGILAATGGYVWGEGYLFLYLANLGTVIGYISMQSIITDFPIHKVDRYMLRIGYIDTFFLTFIYLFTTYQGAAFNLFATPVMTTYIALFLIFMYSNIGASDIRAVVMFLPFFVAVHMTVALLSFLVVGIMIAVIMSITKIRLKDPTYAVPILPYLTVPYMILTPFLPLLVELIRIRTASL